MHQQSRTGGGVASLIVPDAISLARSRYNLNIVANWRLGIVMHGRTCALSLSAMIVRALLDAFCSDASTVLGVDKYIALLARVSLLVFS